MKNNYFKILTALLIFAITSCKSVEKTATTGQTALAKASKSERIALLQANNFSFNTVSAPLKLSIKEGETSKTTSLNAVLKIIEGQQIQLSLRIPILGSEAARLCFTPTQALMIDRINKRYFSDSMENLKLRSGVDFDFYTLQALFANRLFITGKSAFSKDDYQSFTLNETDFTAKLQYADSKNVNYSFTSDWTNKIISSNISKRNTELACNYSDFRQTADNQLFPMKMELSLQTDNDLFFLAFDYSEITVNQDFTLDMEIPRNYIQITLDQMIEMIKSINK